MNAAIREISTEQIIGAIKSMCVESNTILGDDVIRAIHRAHDKEESEVGKDILNQFLENARISREEGIPLCQDTGLAVVFVTLGQDVHLVGGSLAEAVNEGVRQGYRKGYLRKSSLDPIRRENFGDNTPAIIHVELVPGNTLKLSVATKGFGAENMSGVVLLPPSAGVDGVKKVVVERVEKAGANACPPMIVGVGLGGNLEKSAIIAKKALLRPIGQRHSDPQVADFEQALLEVINRLGIGPQGLGGRVTALAVHIETYPTHIGSLPVAVNLQCHCHRHKERVL
jgi:fumarate hydratase subunit alpha